MRKVKERMISIVLSAVMMLSSVPSMAYAADIAEPVAKTQTGRKVQEATLPVQDENQKETVTEEYAYDAEDASEPVTTEPEDADGWTDSVENEQSEDITGQNHAPVENDSESAHGDSWNTASVQALIDALPDVNDITEDNVEAVMAQLDEIDTAKAQLSDEEMALLDLTRYEETIAAVTELTGMEDGSEAVFAAVGMSEPPIGKHTIGVREVDAYEISTKEQLYWFANAVNTSEYKLDYNAVLMNDITVNTGVLDKNGKLNSGNFVEWTPIGYDYDRPYEGRFDGQGHTIRGLYYCNTEKTTDCGGLFGKVTSGLIQNVGVEDSYFRNHWGYVGGFVGMVVNEATISNCYTTAAVECFYEFGKGSFLGVNYNSRYTNRISGCFSAGTVNGSRKCGNFAGSETGCSFYNCYALADSNGTDNYGVVYKTLEQFKNGEVAYWASYPYIGEDSRFRQNIGTDTVPSFSGKPVYYGDGVYHNHNSKDTFCVHCDKPEVYDGTYQIKSKENLYWFAARINGTNGLSREPDAKAVLKTDITVDSNFVSIGNSGAFTGTFDGQGHTISGVTGSLFGSSGGTITDLALQSGVLCTTNTGTISMCGTEGELLCDTNQNIIENSYARHSGSSNVVLCRENSGTIKNCYSANWAGSAVICSSGTEGIQNCYCLNRATAASVGNTKTFKTKKPFASGEVAYLLNENGASSIWYQNIDNGNTADTAPVLHGDKSAIVYKTAADSLCQGYTNHSDGVKQHNFAGGACSDCGALELREPPKGKYEIDGNLVEAYKISTKGQFYWFCALVNGTDGLEQDTSANAVLKADIIANIRVDSTTRSIITKDYYGYFSGEGHTLSVSSNVSLFYQNKGTIINCRVTNGRICHFNRGKVAMCSSGGSSLCMKNVGTIEHCYLYKNRSGTNTLCSTNAPSGKILNCYSANSSGTATICSDNKGTITNCYCLSGSNASAIGSGLLFKTKDPFTSGEVAYRLNKRSSETNIWYQNIDNGDTPDQTPVLNGDSSMIVYQAANGSTCPRYTNLGSNLELQHHYVNGICSYCKQENVEQLTPVTITGITASNKLYNGTTKVTLNCNTAVINGVQSGDDVKVTATGAFRDKNAGDEKIVDITDFNLSGKDAYKYTIADTGNQTTTTAMIIQKTVNAVMAVLPKEYDGTTSAEVSMTIDPSDICAGDSITISGVTGTYEDASVGDEKFVTIHAENMKVTGAGCSNYYIMRYSVMKGTITKKALTVQPEHKSISYGDEKPEYTIAYTGLAECDQTDEFKDKLEQDLVISCPYVQPGQQGATPENSGAGDYAITLSEPSSDENYKNYTLTCKDGILTVKKAAGQITFGAIGDKTYGDADFALAVDTNGSDGDLTYKSSDEKVLTVSENGIVSIIGSGIATITVSLAESANYLADTAEVTVKVKKNIYEGHSLTLGDEIGVNFYMNIPETARTEEAYMEFSVSGKGGKTTRIALSDVIPEKDGRYKFTCRVNAIQMAETVTATYHYGENETAENSYSVKQYVEEVRADNSQLNSVKTLVETLADYGYYAQRCLAETNGWNLDKDYAQMLHYTDPDKVNTAWDLSGYAHGCTGDASGITIIGTSLSLDSKTAINLYFAADDSLAGAPTIAVKDKNGNTVSCNLSLVNSNRYRLTIPGISAHKLGDVYTITVNGTMTIQTSALSYAYTVLNSDQTTDATKYAVAALYEYYRAVMEYRTQTMS